MSTSTKRVATLLGLGLSAAAVAFVAVLIPLIHHGRANPPPPELTAYGYGASVTVAPAFYCDLKRQQCRKDDRVGGQVYVPAGRPLQLSLPKELADAPLVLTAVYNLPDGRSIARQWKYLPNTDHLAITVRSSPGLQLGGVELDQLYTNDGVNYYSSAYWGIRTNVA
jgi:hypothetical protein